MIFISVSYYDQALTDKLQAWIKDDSLKITGPDETRRLFEYRADTNDDAPLKLPLITLRRSPSIEILTPQKSSNTFDGILLEAKASTASARGKALSLNAIPMSINYQIDIYTRYQAEADEYLRNFVYNIVNYPKLSVEIPYNSVDRIHDSTIHLSSTINDNSDIPERLIPGQFTRYTIHIYTDDAYLFSVSKKDTLTMTAEVTTEEN